MTKHGKTPRIVIIGAGPTGLGAAWRLLELGYENWTIIDGASQAGGLAASVVDEQGFVWDKGGHVIFSHYDYFDQLLDFLMNDEWVDHVREAWVWIRNRFIPYPFQNNIWRLPPDDLAACLDGLVAVHGNPPREVSTFADWIVCQFGQGFADVFFQPYNFKVWAYEPKKLDVCWMQERVATVDLPRIQRNVALKQDDLGWGPNARFRFPLHGGTGEIWRRLAALIPPQRGLMGNAVTAVDAAAKEVVLADGNRIKYDLLLSTMALDDLLDRLEAAGDLRDVYRDRLMYSTTHLVGVGLRGSLPEVLRTKCWMYFAEPEIPFYRATVFSNYSPNNVPDPRSNWSLLCEISESADKPVNSTTLADDTIAALKRAQLLRDDSEVISIWQYRLEHGYPTPFYGRDDVLTPLNLALENLDIYSRGRFGAWKYEVSNQDHSLMQGVELIDRLLLGTEERTYNDPASVNKTRDTTRKLAPDAVRRAQRLTT
jgi:protoporphyrinogen oxidase